MVGVGGVGGVILTVFERTLLLSNVHLVSTNTIPLKNGYRKSHCTSSHWLSGGMPLHQLTLAIWGHVSAPAHPCYLGACHCTSWCTLAHTGMSLHQLALGNEGHIERGDYNVPTTTQSKQQHFKNLA